MLRKLLAILLAALLSLSVTGALAEEEARAETVAQLNRLMVEFLDGNGYTYEFDDDTYKLDIPLDSALSSCKVEVRVYYDAIEVISTPQVRATEANRLNTAVLLTLINYKIFYSQFGMLMETGAFYSRGVQLVEKTLPGLEEISVLFHMTLIDLDDYGDGLAEVALAGGDPNEVFNRMNSQ